MPQADAEHGQLAQQLFHLRERILHRLGVARAVAEKHAVGIYRQYVGSRGVPRYAGHVAANACEVLEDGALRTAIVCHHLESRFSRRRERERLRGGQLLGREAVRTLARHSSREVNPHDRGAFAHLVQEASLVDVDGGQHSALCAMVAHMAYERTGVHTLDGHYVVCAQIVRQACRAAPVRRRRTHIAHHEAAQGGRIGLRIVNVHAIIADLGIRQRADLARIRGIRDHLEVTLKRRVEAYLAEHLPRCRTRRTAEHGAVLEHEDRRRAGGLRRSLHQPFRYLAQASILPYVRRTRTKKHPVPRRSAGNAERCATCLVGLSVPP